jgi:hypothetical protein
MSMSPPHSFQIVRRIVDDVLGKERKSMRDIMGALVVKVRGHS